MPGTHPGKERGALDQLVAGERVEEAGRGSLQLVVGTTDPLEEGGDGPGRADLADQLDRTDVDPELEGGGRHEGSQVPRPEALLDDAAARRGETPVVGCHLQGRVDRSAGRSAVRCAVLARHPPASGRERRRRRAGSASGSPPSRMANWWATRSAILRVLTKTRVVRWSRTCSAIRSSTSPSWPPLATDSSSLSGSSMATSRSRRCPQSTMVVGVWTGPSPTADGRPRPGAAGWPTARCAGGGRPGTPPPGPGARGSGPDGRRACRGPGCAPRR